MNNIVLCNNCGHSFLPKDVQFPIIDSLSDLFRSNQLPSSAAAQTVQAYIKGENCELARCEQEISHLHDALRALEAHRATLLERIERCRSWFSPIRRLPVEILGKIFALVCTPESGTYALDVDFLERWSIFAPILALTHVSHHWREVASASPSLWSSVRLSYNSLDGRRFDRVKPLLTLYLTKSRDHPLHLINFRRVNCYQQGQDPIIQLLAPHMPRIARLDLTGPDVWQSSHYPAPKWFTDSRRNDVVPKLSDITIYSHYLDQRGSDIVPCHQLRVLEIVGIFNTRPLGRVLRLCTDLHSLTLNCLHDPEALDAGGLIEIPSLRQLAIAVRCPVGLSFLPQLVLPSLSSLQISAYEASFFVPVTDLVRRSGCHLEEFTMKIGYGSYNIIDADLGNFLTSCPELSRLKVDVTSPYYKDIHPGTSVCQLLDVLSSVSSRQIPIPSPRLSYVIASERWSTLDLETVDALLGELEARIGALKHYRARVPVPRWKWDLRFGALPECAPDILEGFRTRVEKLAKSGLNLPVYRASYYE